MYNRGLFHKWMPGLGTLGLIVLIESMFLLINPVYLGNLSLMASSTGIMSEYFMWGNFSQTIGMALMLPMIMRTKTRFRSKELMITALVAMALMSVVVATTSSGAVVVGACLIFGMAKMLGMVEVILPLQFILSPTGDKKQFYAIFYPIAIIFGNVGSLLASTISLDLSWQALHYYSAGTLLIGALICVICMHNQRFSRKIPLRYVDWLGLFLFALALMNMAYVFSFGKQQDWFTSPRITGATIMSVISIIYLVIRQLKIKHPFLSFKLYRRGDVLTGIFLLIGQGMFMGASSILSIYTQGVLGWNWITSSSLNLMQIPGMIISGFVAYHWCKNQIPIKMYIFSGFAAFLLYFVILYFMMVPNLNIEMLYFPQIFGGYGTCSLFISIWIYTFNRVPPNTMLPSVAPIMVFRSFVMIAFFTALYGWLQYVLQWQSVGNLAFYFDTLTITQGTGVAAIQGIHLGAVLAANKTLLGYTIIAGIGFLTFIFFHQFGEQKYRIARHRIRTEEKRKQSELIPQTINIDEKIKE
jgi:hypothetical protein